MSIATSTQNLGGKEKKVMEGVPNAVGGSEHSAYNSPFLKGTLDFLRENKCIHTYYLCTLQHRLGLDAPLRNTKLSADYLETPHCSEPPSLTL